MGPPGEYGVVHTAVVVAARGVYAPTIGCGGRGVRASSSFAAHVVVMGNHLPHPQTLLSHQQHSLHGVAHTPKRMGVWCVWVLHPPTHPRGGGKGVVCKSSPYIWGGARMTLLLACGPSHINIARSCKHRQEGDTGASVKKHCMDIIVRRSRLFLFCFPHHTITPLVV